MPTNPNMVAIQTVTVGAGGASSISFTSIPQTYTDLKIVLSGRTTQASLADSVYFTFNSSTANFSSRILYGDGGSASSFTQARYAGSQPGSTATASTFANIELYIPNYAGSNNKSYSVDAVTENNGTTAYAYLAAGLWSDTTAISSITLTPNAGSFVQYSTATLYGVTSAGYGAKATGGIITQDANYYYHTFLDTGTFTPSANITCDYLVVAGGGGAGDDYAGGGGAGGLRSTVGNTGGGGSLESAVAFTNGTAYTITVGAGGAGTTTGGTTGNVGNNSSISGSGFTTITSTGGGGGGGIGKAVSNGGSGGGAGSNSGTVAGGTGTSGQGYAGGSATPNGSGYPRQGGGGGAGAVGGNGTGSTSGNGGAGVLLTTWAGATGVGVNSYLAGGGGGGGYAPYSITAGTGGVGGGANGTAVDGAAGASGIANTGGGGGGGAGNQGNGGNGGSGIIVIRYAK